jgi:hypothetical protein
MSLIVDQDPVVRRDVELSAAQQKSRRARNIAIGLALGLFALLFYVVTIVKLGPGILNRPL